MAQLGLPVSVYAVVSGLSGVATGLLAVSVSRGTAGTGDSTDGGRDPDLVRPLLVVLVLLTLSAFGYAVLVADGPTDVGFALPTVILISVPWTVFALRHAGRGHLVSRRRVGAAVTVVAVVIAVVSLPVVTGESSDSVPELLQVTASFLSLGLVGVVFVAAGLVLLATYRHGSTTLTGGVATVLPVGELMFATQVTRPTLPVFSTGVTSVTYAVCAASVVVAVARYDVLSVRPGAGTLGERAVVEELSEAAFVVGRHGEIGRSNGTARELFGSDVDGARFVDVLDCPVTELADCDTVERWTERGRTRFDPRVSTLTNDSGRRLGYAVTLIDVTNREIRRQRIQVLNRILRHNIRNDLDVIRARTEAATDEGRDVDEQAETIFTVADRLESLSVDARRIEKLIGRSRDTERAVDVADLVDRVVSAVEESRPERATVTVDVPSTTLQVEGEILRFALENVVENAVEHTDTPDPSVEIRGTVTDTGIRLVVADDGPGIPTSETDVIETGAEDPLAHATSLGLWGTNWAVQTLGGELSFGESDLGGTAVRIDLPVTPG